MGDLESQLPRAHNSQAGTGHVELEEDESLHFDDMIFLVEQSFFKVARRQIEDSAIFRELLNLPVAENAMPDGSSKEQPFRLEGIDINDFKQFLRIMCPRLGHEESLSLPEWTSVLKLSTMWQFDKIRGYAIEKMSEIEIDLVEKICLARNYHVTEWLLPSFNAYAQRGQPIAIEDVSRLGLDSILKIVEVRENTLVGGSGKCYTCSYCSKSFYYGSQSTNVNDRKQHDFTDALRMVFPEIEMMEDRGCQLVKDASKAIDESASQDDDSFRADDVIILVENCLFKVARRQLEESSIFSDMFRLPVVENAVPDGCSREQPLRLDGIEKADFKQLSKCLHPRFGHEETLSIPEWISVLKLSTMWQFDKIRQFAIDQMSKLQIDMVEKIGLARDYHVKEWLLPALDEYTRLGKPMTTEDVNHLGLDFILKIVGVREGTPLAGKCTHCIRPGPAHLAARQQTDFTEPLRKAFEAEIAAPWRAWSMHKAAPAPIDHRRALTPQSTSTEPDELQPPSYPVIKRPTSTFRSFAEVFGRKLRRVSA